jgi:lysophospholipase L1-like esterase
MLLVAFLLSLGLSLALAEVGARLLRPQNLTGTWLQFSERGYKVNRAGCEVRHQFDGREVRYRFNAQGFRGPALREPPGRPRVMVLGDSFTFGFLLPEASTFVARMQELADKQFGPDAAELVNAGVGSWGAGDYVAFALDHAEESRPDTIVVFVNFDDARRSTVSGLWALDEGGRLVRNDVRFSGWMPTLKERLNRLPMYSWLLEHSHLAQLARRAVIGVHDRQAGEQFALPAPGSPQSAADDQRRAEDARRGVRLNQALFFRLASWCRERNIRLIAISTGFAQPADAEFGPILRAAPVNELFAQQAGRMFADFGVPYLDLAPGLLDAGGGTLKPLRIDGDLHPNEAGAAAIAERAWPWLRDQLAQPRPQP